MNDPASHGWHPGESDAALGRASEGGATATGRECEPAVPLARPMSLDGRVALPFAGVVGVPCAADRWPVPIPRWRALLELVLLLPAGLAGVLLAYGAAGRVVLPDPRWRDVLATLGGGGGAVLGCVLMLALARQRWSSIGWSPRRFGVNVAVGIAALLATYVVGLVALLAATFVYPALLTEPAAARKAIEENFPPMSLPTVACVMAFVVVWEEVVFRGFVLTRLHALFRRWYLAVPLGSLLFGVGHFYEGVLAVVIVGALAMVMGGLFAWRRSLVPTIAFHWLHNVGTFLLLRAVSTAWP